MPPPLTDVRNIIVHGAYFVVENADRYGFVDMAGRCIYVDHWNSLAKWVRNVDRISKAIESVWYNGFVPGIAVNTYESGIFSHEGMIVSPLIVPEGHSHIVLDEMNKRR